MLKVIKGLQGQDELVQYFCAMFDLPKKERQKLAKEKGRDAYYTNVSVQDQDKIVTFRWCIDVPSGGSLQ
jgi:hypothetical protein